MFRNWVWRRWCHYLDALNHSNNYQPLWIFFFFLIFTWRMIALQFCVVSAVQQGESVVVIHTSPSFRASLPTHPTLQVITGHQAEFPVLCSCCPWLSIYKCISVCMLSCFTHIQLFATRQALLPMGFFRWEYWSGLPCLPPGDHFASWPRDGTHISCVSKW